MKKIFLIGALLIGASGFSQVMDIFNNSSKAIVFTVYAYGTSSPYNTCASKIHSTFTIPANTVGGASFASGTWKDASNVTVNQALWGNPVFVTIDYDYQCGSGSIPPPRASCKMQSSACGGPSSLSCSSLCNMTGTWTTLGSDTLITLDD